MFRRLLTAILLVVALPVCAQYNIKKVIEEGRRTLDMGYYLVSMDLFNKVVALKPGNYEAWFLLGKSKFHLEDYEGAESDCGRAIALNPYITDIYELRALCRIMEEKYDSAAVDYTSAIELEPDNREYWFNRAYCFYQTGHNDIARQQLDYITDKWKDFHEAQVLLREVKSGRKPTRKQDRWIESRRKRFTVGKDKWTLKQPAGNKPTELKLK